MPGFSMAGGLEPGLEATAYFKPDQSTYSNSTHVCEVEVDIETGMVTLLRHVVMHDCGRVINPLVVEGQIVGGLAQGLGGALFEEFTYTDSGDPLAVTFADYLMPTAREIPAIETFVSEDAPSPLNTYGFKGAGEGGITPVGAAIASAIDDALQRPGAVTQLPITPWRIKAMLRPQ